jgi:Alpha-(1,6)-fucosyltransferase N- and catalytic domains
MAVLIRHVLGLGSWVRALGVFLFLWAIIFYVFVSKLNTSNSLETDQTLKRLNQALAHLEGTRKVNAELKNLIEEYMR